MSPSLALLLWVVLLLGLLYFDPAREPKTSAALWVPVIWLFFLGSRSPSLWLGLSDLRSAQVQALEQGNPLDRTVYSLLTLLVIAILVSRSFPWGNFIARNSALACFLAFALLSVAWSDFPFATFKKWFRDLGVYGLILVVLSDPRPLEAVRTVLRRGGYLSIPLSVVLIKYYPALGKTFSAWGGQEYTGVSTSKNMLGLLCLASGIFFFWDTITRWHQWREVRIRRVILVNIAFIGMTLWLLSVSESNTSTICLAIGCLVMQYVGEAPAKTPMAPGWDHARLLWECDHDLGRRAYHWLDQPAPDAPRRHPKPMRSRSPIEVELHELARAIPNNFGWEDWNRIGMAFFAASEGSEEGFCAFDLFSAKNRKYDPREILARWENYRRSPPTQIGMGTLIHYARQAGWRPGRAA